MSTFNSKIFDEVVSGVYRKFYMPAAILTIASLVLLNNYPFYLAIFSSAMFVYFLPIILVKILKSKQSPFGEYILVFMIALLNTLIFKHGNLNMSDMEFFLFFFNIFIPSLLIMIFHQSVFLVKKLEYTLIQGRQTQYNKITNRHFITFKGSLGISFLVIIINSLIGILSNQSPYSYLITGVFKALFFLFLLECCRLTCKFCMKYAETYLKSQIMINQSGNNYKTD